MCLLLHTFCLSLLNGCDARETLDTILHKGTKWLQNLKSTTFSTSIPSTFRCLSVGLFTFLDLIFCPHFLYVWLSSSITLSSCLNCVEIECGINGMSNISSHHINQPEICIKAVGPKLITKSSTMLNNVRDSIQLTLMFT